MARPIGGGVAQHPRAVQGREQQGKHQPPDSVVEKARREPVPGSRLAGSPRLGALQLGHPQLEYPACVFLRGIGAQKHAFLTPPVENGEIGLRHKSRRRSAPPPLYPRKAVNDSVHDR